MHIKQDAFWDRSDQYNAIDFNVGENLTFLLCSSKFLFIYHIFRCIFFAVYFIFFVPIKLIFLMLNCKLCKLISEKKRKLIQEIKKNVSINMIGKKKP